MSEQVDRASSPTRGQLDKGQDLIDLAHLIKKSWTEADAAEAHRLVTLSDPGAGADLDRLVDDIQQGRPITF